MQWLARFGLPPPDRRPASAVDDVEDTIRCEDGISPTSPVATYPQTEEQNRGGYSGDNSATDGANRLQMLVLGNRLSRKIEVNVVEEVIGESEFANSVIEVLNCVHNHRLWSANEIDGM